MTPLRLFVAAGLPAAVKNEVAEAVGRLEREAAGGTFTRRENLHVTVAFIGETARVEEAGAVLGRVQAEPFALRLGGFGKFGRRDGDIYWIGVERSPELLALYGQVSGLLRGAGFSIEDREFRPHLTLGRRVRAGSLDEKAFGASLPGWELSVEKLSLMKSERIQGRLAYTAIYEKRLGAST